MSNIFFGHVFTGKHMTQMTVAISAGNFSASTISIWCVGNRAGNFLIKTGPTAMRIEFTVGSIQLSIATAADIGAIFKPIIVFPSARSFRVFMDNDVFFFGGEGVELWHSMVKD